MLGFNIYTPIVINFMKNPNFLLGPIVVGSTMIQRVKSCKLLGVFIVDDRKWSTHVDYIYKKACKRLYSLRLLRRAGISTTGMLKVYLSVIRPILEHAEPVWQSIYEMQSDKLESIQKRAPKVIFPTAETYKDALNLAGLETLASRRTHLCENI